MSNSEQIPDVHTAPIASVTISVHSHGRIEIRPSGMMSADILQAVLLHTLLMVSGQILQQLSSPLVVAGGGVPRAD